MVHFAFFSLNLTRIQFKWSVWVYTVPSFTCPDIVHNQITFRWKDLLLLFWWCWDALGRHNNTDLELKASISFPSTQLFLLTFIHTYVLYWDFWIDYILKMDFLVEHPWITSTYLCYFYLTFTENILDSTFSVGIHKNPILQKLVNHSG